MWYAGKTFEAGCKEYKTLEGGLKAAQKANLNLYDAEGNVLYEATQKNVQEQSEEAQGLAAIMVDNTPVDAKGNVLACDEKGNTVSAEDVEKIENAVMEEVDGVMAVRANGTIRRVFAGALRIRNRPSWDASAVRGVAMFTGEKKITHILIVDGKPMYRTVEGYYISGNEKHVKYTAE